MPLERLFVYVFKYPFHTIVYMLTLSNTWDSNRNLNVIMEPLNFVNVFCQAGVRVLVRYMTINQKSG